MTFFLWVWECPVPPCAPQHPGPPCTQWNQGRPMSLDPRVPDLSNRASGLSPGGEFWHETPAESHTGDDDNGCLGACFLRLIESFQHPPKEVIVMLPMTQMRRRRHGKVLCFGQGCTCTECPARTQNRHLGLGSKL